MIHTFSCKCKWGELVGGKTAETIKITFSRQNVLLLKELKYKGMSTTKILDCQSTELFIQLARKREKIGLWHPVAD